MGDNIVQISVGVAVAVYLIRVVLDYALKLTAKSRASRGSSSTNPSVINPQTVSDIFANHNRLLKLTQDLHDWHDVRDEDHVFAWYIRKSLAEGIVRLNQAVADLARGVAQQNELLKKLCEGEDDHG